MKDIPNSPRIIEIKRRRRMRKLRLVILYFILSISILIALSYFSANKKLVIDKIVIEGVHVLDKEDIEKVIQKNISGKYLHLFSKSNTFIYPNKKIYNDLILNFPRIESLNIKKDNLKTLHLDITERVGTSLYCGKNFPIKKEDIGEDCYFVNNDGFIFDEAPYFSGNVYFKYYLNLENENPLGEQMINIDDFHKLVRFIDEITSLGFKPIYLEEKNGVSHLYLNRSATNTLPEIIFKTDDDLDLVLDNLIVSMENKEFAGEINSKYNTLLYIDLRFKNKVLYKFQ